MEPSKPSSLTEEQRQRIEENRRKALEKKRSKELENKLRPMQSTNTSNGPSPPNRQTQIVNGQNNILAVSNVDKNQVKIGSFYKADQVETSSNKKLFSQGKNGLHITNNDCTKPSIKKPSTFGDKKMHASFSLISRKRFKVEVGYNEKVLGQFKSVPSRSYDMTDKTWNFTIEDHDKLVKALGEVNSIVSYTPLPNSVLKLFKNCNPSCKVAEADISTLDLKLRESLLPFQKTGVYFGINHRGRIMIADDMGLGKTIQSIAIASFYIDEWPLLVVCPSSVRYAWLESFHTWLPSLRKSEINMVDNNKCTLTLGKVIIMSYDMLGRKKSEIDAKKFQVIIFDESHFLKNFKAARTKAAQSASKNAKRVILLSGTPALSRPLELYTQIGLIKPQLFGNYIDFGIRYCNGKTTNFGWDFSGSSNMTELHLILQETVMIRRLKSEVMPQLPPKRRQVIMLDPTKIKKNKKHFEAYSKEMANTELKAMEQRGVLLQYFNETGMAKVSAVCDYVNDILEANYKFLLFAHHKLVLDEIASMLAEKCIGFMRIDGTTPAETRKLNCDRFQLVDSCKVALLSITAANAGLNLCAASLVVFAELFWNPGILTQAEDRAHRIGQQDSVIVQYLVAEGTADDHLWPLIQTKLDTLSEAGLSKDNFRESDTVKLASEAKVGGQNSIKDYFMKNDHDDLLKDLDFDDFCEDDFDEPESKKPHLV